VLAAAGNAAAWAEMATALRECSGATILLSGLSGSGKTAGVHDLAMNTLGMSVYEVNAGTVSCSETFGSDLRHVTRSKTLLGPRLLLVDDVDGFEDGVYLRTIAKFLAERRSGDGPLVMTCTNRYDPKLSDIVRHASLRCLCLRPPNESDMTAVGRILFPCTVPSVVSTHARASCVSGLLHQLVVRLRTADKSRPDEHVNIFRTTEQLLRRKCVVHTWTRCGDPNILTVLLHENCPELCSTLPDAGDDCSGMADFLGHISAAEALRSEASIVAIGLAARTLRPTRVPALRLPKRPRRCARAATARDRDIPALLRDC
jgi:hypothetical protein